MDYKYIEQLLERYWECQTSASEESILRSFFTQEEVPAHLAQYKSLFEYEEVAGQIEYLGEEFDQKALELVGEEKEKISAEEIVIHARRTTTIYRLRPFFRAAASVAIIVLVGTAAQGLFQEKENNQTWDYNQTAYKDSFKENEVDKALEVFRKEMSTISKSLRDTNLVVVDSTKTK